MGMEREKREMTLGSGKTECEKLSAKSKEKKTYQSACTVLIIFRNL